MVFKHKYLNEMVDFVSMPGVQLYAPRQAAPTVYLADLSKRGGTEILL